MAVELFSASSGAMHQPSFSNSSSDNDARALQINTDPHIETNQNSEKSSTTAFQNQPLKKSPFDIKERLFLTSYEVKSSVQRDPLDISGGLRKPTAKTSLNDSSAGLQGTWSAM